MRSSPAVKKQITENNRKFSFLVKFLFFFNFFFFIFFYRKNILWSFFLFSVPECLGLFFLNKALKPVTVHHSCGDAQCSSKSCPPKIISVSNFNAKGFNSFFNDIIIIALITKLMRVFNKYGGLFFVFIPVSAFLEFIYFPYKSLKNFNKK